MPSVALITGASSGFGEACARRFAAGGFSLVLLARRKDRLKKLQVELSALCSAHCEVYCIVADITDAQHLEKELNALPPQFQRIDILVNNAGLALGLERAQDADMDNWETMIETNITALVRMTRMILPGMVARNRGHIINIGSTAGKWPYPGGNVYGASKAFVQQFSRNLRADLLGKSIRVSNIDPGMAETEFSLVRFKHDQTLADKVYAGVKPLSAADIAEIVYWVSTQPPHVNINSLEVMPVGQAWGPLAVDRTMLQEP